MWYFKPMELIVRATGEINPMSPQISIQRKVSQRSHAHYFHVEKQHGGRNEGNLLFS